MLGGQGERDDLRRQNAVAAMMELGSYRPFRDPGSQPSLHRAPPVRHTTRRRP